MKDKYLEVILEKASSKGTVDGRVNGVLEVERGRLIWELLATPLEHAAEVLWAGNKQLTRKIERIQKMAVRKLVEQ